jgi:hypothetical protein
VHQIEEQIEKTSIITPLRGASKRQHIELMSKQCILKTQANCKDEHTALSSLSCSIVVFIVVM